MQTEANVSNKFGSRRDSKPKAKQDLYFNKELLAEMEAESKRLNRPLSWLARESWKLARAKVQSFRAPSTI